MVEKKKNSEYVQTFGKKKNATAVALCREGKGTIRINGKPIDLIEPEVLRNKVLEPILLLGHEKFAKYDIRIRVRGGGYVAQVYAIRMAISRSIVAFNQKFVDEVSKRQLKETLVEYDRGLLIADPRRCEPKKVGGHGARAKKQKSYR